MGIYMCTGQGEEILQPENVVNAIDNQRLQSTITGTELGFRHCVAGIFCSWGGEELERFKKYLRVACDHGLIPFVIEGTDCGLMDQIKSLYKRPPCDRVDEMVLLTLSAGRFRFIFQNSAFQEILEEEQSRLLPMPNPNKEYKDKICRALLNAIYDMILREENMSYEERNHSG